MVFGHSIEPSSGEAMKTSGEIESDPRRMLKLPATAERQIRRQSRDLNFVEVGTAFASGVFQCVVVLYCSRENINCCSLPDSPVDGIHPARSVVGRLFPKLKCIASNCPGSVITN